MSNNILSFDLPWQMTKLFGAGANAKIATILQKKVSSPITPSHPWLSFQLTLSSLINLYNNVTIKFRSFWRFCHSVFISLSGVYVLLVRLLAIWLDICNLSRSLLSVPIADGFFPLHRLQRRSSDRELWTRGKMARIGIVLSLSDS